MRWRKLLSVAAVLAAGIGVAVALGWLALSGRGDAAQLALGRTVYAEHCGACHGAKLEGQPNWQEPLPYGRFPAPPH